MKCIMCGSELREDERFCGSCGYPVETTPIQPQPQAKPKKKHGWVIALVITLVVIGSVAVCIALLLPGLFGPKNLGIKTSEKAYESALEKLNFTKDEAPATGSAEDYVYIYGDPEPVNTTMTSEEITSFFNYNRPEYYPLKNVQVRVNSDDTVDVSFAVDLDYILKDSFGDDYSLQELEENFPIIKSIPGSINIYANVSGGISDNRADGLTLNAIEIMGFDVSEYINDMDDESQDDFRSTMNELLSGITEKTGGSFTSIKIKNGELQIDGMLPSSLTREEVK